MRKNFLACCAAFLAFVSAGFAAAQNQGSITGTVTASQLASTGDGLSWHLGEEAQLPR
jgi:hypothetical protein